MDGARKVRNLFYLLTPAEPDLGDEVIERVWLESEGSWEAVTFYPYYQGHCHMTRQKLSPSKLLCLPPAAWKWATVFLISDLLSTKFFCPQHKPECPSLLIRCSCVFAVLASGASFPWCFQALSLLLSLSCQSSLCPQVSGLALLPCLLPASVIHYKKWSSFQKSRGSVSST